MRLLPIRGSTDLTVPTRTKVINALSSGSLRQPALEQSILLSSASLFPPPPISFVFFYRWG